MRRFAWIWFVGCVVWLGDGFLSAHYQSWAHAELAFLLALVFLAAGLLSSRGKR